ncbi:zinc-binding oxidoreductase [Colletotrichum godetiae]|uniref:Zinc-binding oxidoreductase n=1 Tax=Colletotrichum godetiae TaxID=1209918 RepID=A0AAJ0EX25_9PEZI|nr:zinc-binding oxidoreductase [Colletotrichum godetiae]KAK1676898.1 zinc-binding oxidoreductase [Colletotrichum godetiae]
MGDTMKAWQYSAINNKLEDSLIFNNLAPMPSSSDLRKDELIIKVISVSLNPADFKVPESTFIGRLMVARPATPAMDFCGRVVATHPSNSSFQVGQLVFGGYAGVGQRGTLAEYIVISGAHCAPLPDGIDPDQGAAVGTAATTAWQSLMPDALKTGGKVFINGGSGGTGTWAIQLAKALGVEVVTTCSTKNIDLCRQLGADEVVDYTKEDILSNLKDRGKVFDLIIDNVGSCSELYDNSSAILKPNGTFVMVGVGESLTLSGSFSMLSKIIYSKTLGGERFYFVRMQNTADYFRRIGELMVEGETNAVVDSTFGFEQVPDAYRRLREGHAKGKIIVHVSKSSGSSTAE